MTEGVPDTLIANWSGPGVGMDDVTSGSVSAQTHENGSSFTFNLTFHSLRQSYNGEYICSAHLTIVSLNDTSVTALAVVGECYYMCTYCTFIEPQCSISYKANHPISGEIAQTRSVQRTLPHTS